MKKIMFHAPDPNDACSFYRGIAPLSRLRHAEIIQLPERISWSSLCGGDIGFLLRPFHDKHVTIAELIKKQMPLWIDYDDDLMNVPPENPAFQNYSRLSVKANIKTLCEMADVITVTTQFLSKQLPLDHDFSKVHVIPNAYNDYLLPVDLPTEPRDKVVMWRGSNSHVKDLLDYKDEIIELVKKFPDWKFVFVGSVPWQISHEADVAFVPGVDIFDYFDLIRNKIKPSIMMVPLTFNEFNKSKSNIAWIEATMAGAATVGPKMSLKADQWGEGVRTYNGTMGFYHKISHLICNPKLRKHHVNDSYKHIQDNLLLSQVNNLRAEIVNQL